MKHTRQRGTTTTTEDVPTIAAPCQPVTKLYFLVHRGPPFRQARSLEPHRAPHRIASPCSRIARSNPHPAARTALPHRANILHYDFILLAPGLALELAREQGIDTSDLRLQTPEHQILCPTRLRGPSSSFSRRNAPRPCGLRERPLVLISAAPFFR